MSSAPNDTFNLVEPQDIEPSCNGHGTLEILELTKNLEEAGIPCCLVGVSALRYFGVPRMGYAWEICIPTNQLDLASSLLRSERYINKYIPSKPVSPGSYLRSLLHTFPRFKCIGLKLWFQFIPSQDAYLACEPSNFERSKMGLPYPKLEVFVQSLLYTGARNDLGDVVDGMNLSEEWGKEHLDLNGSTDVAWAEKKNQEIIRSQPLSNPYSLALLTTNTFSLRELWENAVRGKERRLSGPKKSKDMYVTIYRLRSDTRDPRSKDRTDV